MAEARYFNGRWKTTEACCETFAKATRPGTDSEGVGSLAGFYGRWWTFGSVRTPAVTCPWCSKTLRAPKEESHG